MTKRVEGLRTKQANPPAEIDNDKYSTLDNYKNLSQFEKESNGNNNNHRNKNKDCKCPFRCGTCDLLKEYVKSRYEVVNILEDDSKLIFSPLFERCVN